MRWEALVFIVAKTRLVAKANLLDFKCAGGGFGPLYERRWQPRASVEQRLATSRPPGERVARIRALANELETTDTVD